MQKLRTGKTSINQAYKSIYKEESVKNNDKHNSNSRLTLKSNIIFAFVCTAATSTTSPTAIFTSHVLNKRRRQTYSICRSITQREKLCLWKLIQTTTKGRKKKIEKCNYKNSKKKYDFVKEYFCIINA